MEKRVKYHNQNRRQLSVDSETYRLLKLAAKRSCRSMARQVKFYVEQDLRKGREDERAVSFPA